MFLIVRTIQIFQYNLLAYLFVRIIDQSSFVVELIDVAHFLRNSESKVFIEDLDSVIERIVSHVLLSLEHFLVCVTSVVHKCLYFLQLLILELFCVGVLKLDIDGLIIPDSLSSNVSHLLGSQRKFIVFRPFKDSVRSSSSFFIII